MKLFVILIFSIASFVSCKSQNKEQPELIGIETIRTDVIGKDVQLVDVRTPKEYNTGHIDDAINIDFLDESTFTEKVSKLDKEKPVYIYCQMGGRSKKASQKLISMGFKTIYDYSGGYGEWSRQQ
ncbi:rhodanese-like domain-containing protein [Sediminicola arcticus]|uniref:Rhodanese-like domain-containing protein n=1 Tax=Sediminicola arcticus TaxID=1574308 RepID=A0ABV2SV20_9FLAO